MPKKLVVTVKGKRPADATLEKLLKLRQYLTLAEIGQLWGISRQRVWALEKRAKELRDGLKAG